ncbi:MAG: hypothetical protein RI955_147 [Bacteroidota bacterium]
MFFITDVDAQSTIKMDTIKTSILKKDSVATTASPVFKPNPKRAAIYSAVCPGLGQIYNRKYWKAPIVYTSIGVASYFILVNYSGYTNTRNGITRLQDNDASNDNEPILVRDYSYKKYDLNKNGASVDDLLRIKKYFRQNIDVSVLTLTALYILNIVDANIDAHLSGFNMSDDLTIAPLINQYGVGIAFQFK